MEYNLLATLGIWVKWRTQRVLYDVWGLKPLPVGDKAPSWFRAVYPAYLWALGLEDDKRPKDWLIDYCLNASDRLIGTWVSRLLATAVSNSFAAMVGLTGRPKHGYYTLESWLEAIRTRVGSWIPGWTTTLATGLDILYWKLPDSIGGGYGSWSELWEGIKNSVKEWAKARYDAFRVLAQNGWTWITSAGSLLSAWYDQVGTWVSNFKQNPSGVILGVLGSTWDRLVTFTRDALTFYYNLWGDSRQTLFDFVHDPLGYLYDRVEQFLIDKW